MASERNILRSLYRKIPKFECERGCSDCCGPVPLTEYERSRIGAAGLMTPVGSDNTCMHVCKHGCHVYDRRPFMCRLFGAVDGLRCPKGYGPEKLLSEQSAKELLGKYKSIMAQQETPNYAGES